MPFTGQVSIHISQGEWPVLSLGLFLTNIVSGLHRAHECYIRHGEWPVLSLGLFMDFICICAFLKGSEEQITP